MCGRVTEQTERELGPYSGYTQLATYRSRVGGGG